MYKYNLKITHDVPLCTCLDHFLMNALPVFRIGIIFVEQLKTKGNKNIFFVNFGYCIWNEQNKLQSLLCKFKGELQN